MTAPLNKKQDLLLQQLPAGDYVNMQGWGWTSENHQVLWNELITRNLLQDEAFCRKIKYTTAKEDKSLVSIFHSIIPFIIVLKQVHDSEYLTLAIMENFRSLQLQMAIINYYDAGDLKVKEVKK